MYIKIEEQSRLVIFIFIVEIKKIQYEQIKK